MFSILFYIFLGLVCPNLSTTGNNSHATTATTADIDPDTGGETGHIPPGPPPPPPPAQP